MLESQQYLKTVIDTMQNGLMVVDERGEIVDVNPVMEDLTGYSRCELIGAPCSILGCGACPEERVGGGRQHCALFARGEIRRLK